MGGAKCPHRWVHETPWVHSLGRMARPRGLVGPSVGAHGRIRGVRWLRPSARWGPGSKGAHRPLHHRGTDRGLTSGALLGFSVVLLWIEGDSMLRTWASALAMLAAVFVMMSTE